MGVHGLWPLLEPVGRRINIEALSNKRLAVSVRDGFLNADASIWLYQFMKAMRNDRGEFMRNGHILGFFRRICRLLFHRVRPVFVFDGATPALKRQTAAARRRRREVQNAKLRKTAEKLLLNQMKQHALKGALSKAQPVAGAAAGSVSAAKSAPETAAGGAGGGERREEEGPSEGKPNSTQAAAVPTVLDFSFIGQPASQPIGPAAAASNDAECQRHPGPQPMSSAPEVPVQEEDEPEEPDEEGVEEWNDEVLGFLQPQRQGAASEQLQGRRRVSLPLGSQGTGQQGEAAEGSEAGASAPPEAAAAVAVVGAATASELAEAVARAEAEGETDWEAEAGLEDEDPGGAPRMPRVRRRRRVVYGEGASSGSSSGSSSDGEGEDGTVMAMPDDLTNVDPEVLSTLPPSMQMEILLKMREGQMASNRERFQEVAEAPGQFSEVQLQTYLKASSFRRNIDSLRDAINDSAGSMSHAKRIASAEGREYVLRIDESAKEMLRGGRRHAAAAPGLGGSGSGRGRGGRKARFLPEIAPADPDAKKMAKMAAPWTMAFANPYRQNGHAAGGSLGQAPHEDAAAAAGHGLAAAMKVELGSSPASASAGAPEPTVEQTAAAPDDVAVRAGAAAVDIDLSGLASGGEEAEAALKEGAELFGDLGAPVLEEGEPDGEWEEEWEDVEAGPAKTATQQQQQHWRERMAKRQKYWSMAHGFKMGRKLGDWGAEQAPAAASAGDSGNGAAGRSGAWEEEEAEIQEAIRRSLVEADAAGDLAGPSTRAARTATEPGLHGQAASGVEMRPPVETSVEEDGVIVDVQQQQQRKKKQKRTEWAAKGAAGEAAMDARQGATSEADGRDATPAAAAMPLRDADEGGQAVAAETCEGLPARQPDLQGRISSQAGARGSGGVVAPVAKASTGLPGKDSTAAEHRPGRAVDAALEHAAEEVVHGAGGKDRLSAAAQTVQREGAGGKASPPDGNRHSQAVVNEPSALSAGMAAAAARPHVPSGVQPARGSEPDEAQAPAAPAPTLLPPGKTAAGGTAVARAVSPSGSLAEASALHSVDEDELEMALKLSMQQDEGSGNAADPGPCQSGAAAAAWKPAPSARPEAAVADAAPVAAAARQGEGAAAASEHSARSGLEGAGAASGAGAAALADDVRNAVQGAVQEAAGMWEAALEGADAQQLESQLEELERQGHELQQTQRRAAAYSEAPTTSMYTDCQELLQMFGLPYLIAPMEAEAQCAWLNEQGLVDGVVTEDNDVFLFGARVVYRRVFDDNRYVEEHRMDGVEQDLGLDRESLIQIAQLLGSDYTEGISGIGIVNAVEVVHAFPGNHGLSDFRTWVQAPDSELLTAARGLDGKGEAAGNTPEESGSQAEVLQEFKRRHKAVRKNWELPESWPNPLVSKAYLSPQVDSSTERFTFGRPDVELLSAYCSDKLGWDGSKVEGLLAPVVKAWEAREIQLTMHSFLSFRQRFAKVRSKRLRKALEGITGSQKPEMVLADLRDGGEAPAKAARSKKAGLQGRGRGRGRGNKGREADSAPDAGAAAGGPGVDATGAESAAADKPSTVRKRGRGRGHRAGRGRGKERGPAAGPSAAASEQSAPAEGNKRQKPTGRSKVATGKRRQRISGGGASSLDEGDELREQYAAASHPEFDPPQSQPERALRRTWAAKAVRYTEDSDGEDSNGN